MIRVNKNKKSKFEVWIGYGLCLYADTLNDINNLKNLWSSEKVTYYEL